MIVKDIHDSTLPLKEDFFNLFGISFKVYGDIDKARERAYLAQRLMFQTKMTNTQNLDIVENHLKLDDGTVVHVMSQHGLDTAQIYVPETEAQQQPVDAETTLNVELLYEFFTAQAAEPEMAAGTLTGVATSVKIPPDGGEYTFEVLASNTYDFAVTLTAYDSAGTVCSTIVIPGSTAGDTTYETLKFTEEFTEGDGDYHLKLTSPEDIYFYSPDGRVMITTARIKLYKEEPTEARVQILLLGGEWNYYFLGFNDEDPSLSNGWGYPIRTAYGSPSELDDFTSSWGSSLDLTAGAINSWRYSSEEFDTVEQVTYSVGVLPQQLPRITTREFYIYSTWAQTGYDFVFYTVPEGTDYHVSSSSDLWVDKETSFVDNNGVTFIPISFKNTDGEAIPVDDVGADGSIATTHIRHPAAPGDGPPVVGEITLIAINKLVDVPGVYAPDVDGTVKFNIHLGGVLYGWGGSVPGDTEFIANWGQVRPIELEEGESLYLESISYEQVTDTQLTMEWRFVTVSNLTSDTSVALHNMTTDTIVAGSTMVWVPWLPFSRQEAVIELEPDCEYKMVLKCPGQSISTPGQDPDIVDAQLLIDVSPVTSITTYNRLGRGSPWYMDNWAVPYSWGGNCVDDDGYAGGVYMGCRVSIDERAFPYISSHFFDACCFITYTGDTEVCATFYLEDLTEGDITGSGEAGEDVEDSGLIWPTNAEVRLRQRTDSLSILNNHTYGLRNSGAEWSSVYLSNGFLVCKYSYVEEEI